MVAVWHEQLQIPVSNMVLVASDQCCIAGSAWQAVLAQSHLQHSCRYPEGDLDTNLTIVITNVGADFTRLGSFGDAEQFGGTLVAQMDRSYLNRSWNKPKTPVQVLDKTCPTSTPSLACCI